ncbi:MAG TPA: thioredoxin-dependent thiol peroxidase [Myxococcota bacterium]|nr:thioredoxin-dependent thiol peroxidase [Myxococcota bacterium]HND34718.1 thioredoxin-dependent thiol peroxidase [Myxococcota bacterium]HNH46331.1 thioredoxin-dependent thiol peroxidase [Myxococcota bacterium]
MPAVGEPAPDFSAPLEEGSLTLSSLRGKKVLLYFYPKDSTPGCTLEARGFRDHHDALAAKGVVVLGVSKDTAKKHQSFKTKECLPFSLVSDTVGICEAYGVWRQKKLYGREYMGIARVSFLIDEQGKIARIWDPVKAEGHAAEVLATL